MFATFTVARNSGEARMKWDPNLALVFATFTVARNSGTEACEVVVPAWVQANISSILTSTRPSGSCSRAPVSVNPIRS